jgi:bile acid:Na+ symporter, BASS family
MKLLLDIAVPAITAVLLLAIGLHLSVDDFNSVRRNPLLLVCGLGAPLLLLPPIALGLLSLFEPTSAVQTGLLLIAVCPIGGISNTYSYLAGASLALSISLTACSSLLAVVTVPLLDRAIGMVVDRPLGLSAPVPLILAQLLVMLAIPVGAGMWIRFRRPALAARLEPRLKGIGFAALAVLLVLIVASAPAVFLDGLTTTVPLAAVFVVISFATGWAVAASVTGSAPDCFTIATEFATRNVAVATAIAVTLAGRVDFAYFGTTYFLTEVPLMLAAVAAFRARLPAAV